MSVFPGPPDGQRRLQPTDQPPRYRQHPPYRAAAGHAPRELCCLLRPPPGHPLLAAPLRLPFPPVHSAPPRQTTKLTVLAKFLSRPTRLVKSLLAIALVGVIVVTGRRMGASGGKRSPNQAQAAAAALLEFHGLWTTDGDAVVFSRDRRPASLKALQMNSVEVNRFWAYAWRREDGPWGLWWSSGYQIQRQHTNDNTWTLYQFARLEDLGSRDSGGAAR